MNSSRPGAENAAKPESVRTEPARWKVAVSVATAVVWLIGTGVRLTIRDAAPITAPVFYALPVPVLLVVGWIPMRVIWRTRRRRLALCAAIILVCQAFFWGEDAFRRQTDFRKDSLRILFWNVARGSFGYDGIVERIGFESPDIVAVVEATHDGQAVEFWESRLPDFSATCLGGGMTLLTHKRNDRFVVSEIEKGQVPRQLRYRVVSLRIDGRPLSVLIADIKSDPLHFRRPAFKHLAEITGQRNDQPVILAGDLNTPVDSRHVDLLRDELANAFEVSGAGYRETWPVVFPVLSLDQLWANDHLRWHRCWTAASMHSDHRLMIAEFSIQ